MLLGGGGALVILLGVGCSSKETPTATVGPTVAGSSSATPTASVEATSAPSSVAATATAEAGPTVEPVEIEQGWFELPANVAVVIAENERLVRLHRTIEGTIEERVLFDITEHGGTRVLSFGTFKAPTSLQGQLAVSVCTGSGCGGMVTTSEVTNVTIFRSRDGGVTWEANELDEVWVIVEAEATDQLILRSLRPDGAATTQFEWWPSGEAVERPIGDSRLRDPEILPDGQVAWWAPSGRLLDSDGSELLDLGAGGDGLSVLPEPGGKRLAVIWREFGEWRWSVAEPAGAGYEITRTFAAPIPMAPVAWLGETQWLMTGNYRETQLTIRDPGHLATVFDFSGVPARVMPFGEDLGSGWAVAAQVGPFAEVRAGEGDCLNIRSGPSLDDEVLECVADGVLLAQVAPPGGDWTEVRAPSGVAGWASSEFLAQASDEIVGAIEYLLRTMYHWLRIAQGWTPDCGPDDACLDVFDFPENVRGVIGMCGKTDVAGFRAVRRYREHLHEQLIAYWEVPCTTLWEAQERLGPPADTPEWQAVVAEVAEYLEPRYGSTSGLIPPEE